MSSFCGSASPFQPEDAGAQAVPPTGPASSQPLPAGAALPPSKQVAFLHTQVEELEKVLGMAKTVAALLERCQAIEQTVGSEPGAADPPSANGDATASMLSSLGAAAEGVQKLQRDALRRLMLGALTVTDELSLAVALTLRELGGEAPGEPARRRGRGAARSETGQPLPADELAAEGGSPGEPSESLPAPAQDPATGSSNTEVGGAMEVEAATGVEVAAEEEAAGEVEAAAEEEAATEVEAAVGEEAAVEIVRSASVRPLEAWLNALVGLYSAALPRPPGKTPLALEAPRSSPRPGPVVESTLTLSGVTTLAQLMAAHRALGTIPQVVEVRLARVAAGTAELTVKHGIDLDLRAASGPLLEGMAIRLAKIRQGLLLLS